MKGSNCAVVNLAAAEMRSYTSITGSNVLQGVGIHVILETVVFAALPVSIRALTTAQQMNSTAASGLS
jgi:hypothetical protein